MKYWSLITVLLNLSFFGISQAAFDSPIVSEFLSNYSGALETEWVELYNPLDFDIDLRGSRIGDELGWRNISDTVLILPPHSFIILAQDRSRFLEYYSDFFGLITEPEGWQILNNDGDVVRLGDASGATVDSVIYESVFSDNRSWERYVNPEGESFWGGSFDASGSTPGKPNGYFYPRSSSIDVDVNPDPFSPNGDGFEDVTLISCNPPDGEVFELAVYDISGRKVRTFFDREAALPCEITWDGRGDDGRRLPVGIYVLYARVEGGTRQETRRTVVIAQ